MASNRPPSKDLMPGTRLRWAGMDAVGRTPFAVLQHRKMPDEDHHGIPYQPGWWCEGGGGLADYVIDAEHSQWEIIEIPGAEGSRD